MDRLPNSPHRDHAEFAHCPWSAEPRQLTLVRATVRDWLGPLRLTDCAQEDMVLAVSEAASNAVEHAYLTASPDDVVEVTFWTERDWVWIEIVDHGRWKTPSVLPNYRGRGIAIMERVVDSVLIHYDSRGTRVLLGHRLTDESGDLPAGQQQPV